MNKKLVAIAVLSLVIGSSSLFAFGIGLQGGFSAGPGGAGGGTGAVTFKLDTMPWVFAANATFGNQTSIGVTADNWLANKRFVSILNYYYGWGLAGAATVGENAQGVFVGARALGGLNLFMLDKVLEFYIQIAWQPGVALVLAQNSSINPVLVNFPGAFGFRFWF